MRASVMARLPKISSWVILCAMLRLLAAALFLLTLTACAAPPAVSPISPTESPAPSIALATFTPTPKGAAVGDSVAAPFATPAPAATPTRLSNFWQLLFPGAEITQTADGLVAFRHAPNLVRYDVLFEGDPVKVRQLSQWLDEAPDAMAGVNCGFYWEHEGAYRHLGLLEANGQRLASVRARWGAALIVRDGKAEIVRQPKKRIPALTLGIQGWPTLLWRGEVVTEPEELVRGEVARRTAVGVDASGRMLWVVDPTGSALQAFAERLRREDIGLVDAVNLDGGSSTGLRWREEPGDSQSGVESLPIPCAITFSPLVK